MARRTDVEKNMKIFDLHVNIHQKATIMEEALNNKEDNKLDSECQYLSLATLLLAFWSQELAEDTRMDPPYRGDTLEST